MILKHTYKNMYSECPKYLAITRYQEMNYKQFYTPSFSNILLTFSLNLKKYCEKNITTPSIINFCCGYKFYYAISHTLKERMI